MLILLWQIHNKRPIPTNRCWMQEKKLIIIWFQQKKSLCQNRMSNPNNYLDSFTMPMKTSCKNIRSSIPFVICLLGACSQKKNAPFQMEASDHQCLKRPASSELWLQFLCPAGSMELSRKPIPLFLSKNPRPSSLIPKISQRFLDPKYPSSANIC